MAAPSGQRARKGWEKAMSIDATETNPDDFAAREPALHMAGPDDDGSIGYECADPALCAPEWAGQGDASRPGWTLR
ncbi:hypothetical protein [Piscinibacter terrae]|nr:hypothetical protein [Albitalea terrae]